MRALKVLSAAGRQSSYSAGRIDGGPFPSMDWSINGARTSKSLAVIRTSGRSNDPDVPAKLIRRMVKILCPLTWIVTADLLLGPYRHIANGIPFIETFEFDRLAKRGFDRKNRQQTQYDQHYDRGNDRHGMLDGASVQLTLQGGGNAEQSCATLGSFRGL
jgi:hypothetical protein